MIYNIYYINYDNLTLAQFDLFFYVNYMMCYVDKTRITRDISSIFWRLQEKIAQTKIYIFVLHNIFIFS